jgi:hypothetical protein
MAQTIGSSDDEEVNESKTQKPEPDSGPVRGPATGFRPLARSNQKAYDVKDEIVLVPDHGDNIYALNASSSAIWRLCDGHHSLTEILRQLCTQYSGENIQMMSDITTALFNFQALELLEPGSLSNPGIADAGISALAPSEADRPRLRIVHGIEDKPYFHWQLAIMFESLVGQMPAGWEINVVVCNNHLPVSAELKRVLDTYGVRYFTGESHADNHHIDFAGGGDRYVPVNRVEALNIISRHVAADEIVCLMDTDIFLYGELQEELFPRGNAITSNWIVAQEKYFHFSTNDTRGLSLPKLLEALGCEQEFKPGGVMVFLTGETLQANDRKVIRDCFRFLQILYLAGKILDLPDHGVWVAEMACFAMAMYPNGIDYELLDIEQFAVQEQNADKLEQGTFFHYYTDINDGNPGPFYQSQWHKQLYSQQDFLSADIESFLEVAGGEAEKRFMNLAIKARERVQANDT